MLSIGSVNNTIVNASPATTAETVIATTSAVATPKDNVLVLVLFTVTIIGGTTQSSCTFRVRQGTTVAGAIVQNNMNTDAVAAVPRATTIFAMDTALLQANAQWSLTFQGVANTANAGVTQVVAAVLFLA